MARQKKIFLEESEMPKQWYNLAPDLPTPLNPPLGPDGKPITPEMLAPVFPMNLIEQEVSMERWIDIPEEIRQILFQWRPSPLIRAYELEEALGTPAKIFYKNTQHKAINHIFKDLFDHFGRKGHNLIL